MTIKEASAILLVLGFFLLSSFVAREFSGDIAEYFNTGPLGLVIYIWATIVATVVAPISTVPLIPIASALWGPLVTAFLNIISWSIGSVIAFLIAHRFGKPYVARFVNINSISKYEKSLSEEHLFWHIVFLRMAVPVDILSYAIGLFSSVKLGPFTMATILGITPFAFILSYASSASLPFQIGAGVLVGVMFYLGYRKVMK